MKYIKLAIQYMTNKHFWKLALMALVPSIVVSLFSSFSTTASYIIHFFDMDLSSFGNIYNGLSEMTWQRVLGLIAVVILFALVCAIMIGAMQRHMRTGTFAITNIFKRLNEHLLPSLLTIAVVFIFIFLFGLTVSLTVAFWWAITHNYVATFVMTLLLVIVYFMLMLAFLCLFSLSLPNVVCTGQGYLDSASYSIRTTRRIMRPLFVAFGLPLIIFMALQFPLVFVEIRAVHIIIDSIMVFCISCYYPVLIFVTYYDINDKERQDLLPANRL